MKPFDVAAVLAHLDSPEAALLDGSVVVTGSACDILGDMLEVFVSTN